MSMPRFPPFADVVDCVSKDSDADWPFGAMTTVPTSSDVRVIVGPKVIVASSLLEMGCVHIRNTSTPRVVAFRSSSPSVTTLGRPKNNGSGIDADAATADFDRA